MDWVLLGELGFFVIMIGCHELHARHRRALTTSRLAEVKLVGAVSGRLRNTFAALAHDGFERQYFAEVGSTLQLTPEEIAKEARRWREDARATTPPAWQAAERELNDLGARNPLGPSDPPSVAPLRPCDAPTGRTEGPASMGAAGPDLVAPIDSQRSTVDLTELLREGPRCAH